MGDTCQSCKKSMPQMVGELRRNISTTVAMHNTLETYNKQYHYFDDTTISALVDDLDRDLANRNYDLASVDITLLRRIFNRFGHWPDPTTYRILDDIALAIYNEQCQSAMKARIKPEEPMESEELNTVMEDFK